MKKQIASLDKELGAASSITTSVGIKRPTTEDQVTEQEAVKAPQLVRKRERKTVDKEASTAEKKKEVK